MAKQINISDVKEINLTGKGLLLTTLLLPHEEGDKMLIAREIVAKRLAQNGLRQKDLEKLTGSHSSIIPFVHPWMEIAQFIQTLTDKVVLAEEFTEWVYRRGYYSDADSFWALEETGRS